MTAIASKILVIDDEAGIREQLVWGLKAHHEVYAADSAESGIAELKKIRPMLVILDLSLTEDGADDEGLQVFEEIQIINPETKVIIITGNEQKELALKAVKMGAYDFYKKPIDLDELKVIVNRALQFQKLEQEARALSSQAYTEGFNGEIIGQSSKMLEVYDTIERTSQTNATILIDSESGTGKELIARAIHAKSPRKDKPFVVINCGAIPENLLESELFGHEKGSFTGAHAQKKGKFELADKGTLFLDEIGEMPIGLQVKLLRFLQEREIERVGGREPIVVDVRIIAATNRDLEIEIENGTFRADLFYRLSVITINLPPLRERGDDLMRLAEHFLVRFNQEYGTSVNGFSSEAKDVIERYPWPGNVRELENKIKRSVIMARGSWILPQDLSLKSSKAISGPHLRDAVDEFEENCIREALFRNSGNVSRTAEELGVNRTTFYDLLRKYNIDRADFVNMNEKT